MVKIFFISISISISIFILLTGCASHQDLLAPQYPGEAEPINNIWKDSKNGLENKSENKLSNRPKQ